MSAKEDGFTKLRVDKTLIFAILVLLIAVCSAVFCGCNDIEDQIPSVDYTITFVLNNGEQNIVWKADKDICPLDIVDGIPTPKYDGKVFGGWFCDESLKTPLEFDFENIFLADSFTIYAKWLDPNNFEGLVFEDTSVTYDGKPHTIVVSNLPEGATVTYLDELQYIDAGEYVVRAVVKMDGYNDLSLSATLTINKAKIDGVKFENKTVEWDGKEHFIYVSGLPSGVDVDYTNNGQSLVGVYEVCASFDVGNNYLPLNDMVATLTISQKICEVTFVVGDAQTVVDVPYGSTVLNAPSIEQKDGYEGRWNVDISTIIRDDITLTAVYVPIEYKIEFELCGGQGDFQSIIYTIEDEDIILENPSRDRYDFGGWFADISYSGNRIERTEKGTFGNFKLYAKWIPTEYAIDYVLNLDGATNDLNNPSFYTIESDIICLNKAGAVGYKFCGWFLDDAFTQKVENIDPAQFDGSITLYALWEKEGYSVSYVLNGGENDERNPKRYVPEVDCPLYDAKRENYDFLGWYDDRGNAVTNLANLNGDQVLTAKWTPTIYYIHYDLAGGVNDIRNKTSFTVEDENIPLYEASREHFQFDGWQENGNTIDNIDTRCAKDVYLTARWSDIWYTIEYVADGGSFIGDVVDKYTFFMSVNLPGLTKQDHDFEGWYDNQSFEGERIDSIAQGSVGNKIFYAKFTENIPLFEYELKTCDENGETVDPYFAITKYVGESDVVVVPSTIRGNKIEKVCASTFLGFNMTEIVIEEGITDLEQGVFDGLTALRVLKLPSTIAYIHGGLLADCSSLEELVLPFVGDRIYKKGEKNRNLYGFSYLFSMADAPADGYKFVQNCNIFADETGSVRVDDAGTYSLIPATLFKVTILDGDIFANAFAYCGNIGILELRGGEYIADFAMRECSGLKTLIVGDAFNYISSTALYSCSNIENIMVGTENQRALFEEWKEKGKIGANIVISIDMHIFEYVEEEVV